MLRHANQLPSGWTKLVTKSLQIIQSSWNNSRKLWETSLRNNRRSFMVCPNLTLILKISTRQRRVTKLARIVRLRRMTKSTRHGLANASMSLSIQDWTMTRSLTMSHLQLQTNAEMIGVNSIHPNVLFVSLFSTSLVLELTWTMEIKALGQLWSMPYPIVTGLLWSSTPINTVMMTTGRHKASVMRWKLVKQLVSPRTISKKKKVEEKKSDFPLDLNSFIKKRILWLWTSMITCS